MLGRGVDQISRTREPHPVRAQVRDARTYVDLAIGRMATSATGRLVVALGDALDELGHANCGARIINFETSITTSDHSPGQGRPLPDEPGKHRRWRLSSRTPAC